MKSKMCCRAPTSDLEMHKDFGQKITREPRREGEKLKARVDLMHSSSDRTAHGCQTHKSTHALAEHSQSVTRSHALISVCDKF